MEWKNWKFNSCFFFIIRMGPLKLGLEDSVQFGNQNTHTHRLGSSGVERANSKAGKPVRVSAENGEMKFSPATAGQMAVTSP